MVGIAGEQHASDMIRLAFQTDAARVIGATTPEGNAKRFELLPPALGQQMDLLCRAPNVVVGAPSLQFGWKDATDTKVFVLSRDPEFTAPAPHIEVVRDVKMLIERFEHSDEELLVAGGRKTLQLFAAHAAKADIAMTHELVPGDLVFRDWEGRFLLDGEDAWEGGVTRHYRGRGRGLNNAISLYMEGIRDGHAHEAVKQYTGARYTQHSTGVPDGQEGFIQFFEDFLQRNPKRDIRVVRALEDGQYVFVHAYQSLNDGEWQWVTTDFFDTDAEHKMIEHWDVISEFASTPSGHTTTDGPTEVTDLDATEANKATVRRLIEDCLIGTKADTVLELVAENYIQHNREVPDGREHFHALVAAPDRPLFYSEIVLMVGQGNFVATLCKATWEGKPYAQVDLFRLEGGRIVEHWDNAEPVPENPVNSGKF